MLVFGRISFRLEHVLVYPFSCVCSIFLSFFLLGGIHPFIWPFPKAARLTGVREHCLPIDRWRQQSVETIEGRLENFGKTRIKSILPPSDVFPPSNWYVSARSHESGAGLCMGDVLHKKFGELFSSKRRLVSGPETAKACGFRRPQYMM